MSEQNSTNPLAATGGTDITAGDSGGGFLSGLHLEGHPAIRGLSQLTLARQVAIMLGLALSVAIGIAVVLWSQDANYARLYTELNDKDTAEILDALNAQGVKYKIEEGGAIMVMADKVNDTKIKLAAQGLPKSNSLGYELLDKEQSFGTSKTAELARHQRALEGEIARTIMSIQSVKNARVLLALPVQSVFVRERKKPSASVIVHLYQGRSLDKGQVEAIVHLVSSSVPQLDADHVTVVDYKGQMLNSRASAAENLTASQFEYKTGIEEHLMHRIENIMSPLVGAEAMRVQISADVDFTETDKTQEMFNPDLPALRSEQTTDEQNKENPQGVPGALSNQPTPAGAAIETIPPVSPNSLITDTNGKGYESKTATRNYELDKTITHTKLATGVLRRLSVAVVVDDRHIPQSDGATKSQPYAQEDLNRFNDLVKQAVGFDSGRGDQVTVTNVSFRGADLDLPPELPLWKEVWFVELVKQAAAVLAILFLIFGVLRPTIRALIAKDEEEKRAIAEAEEQARAAALLAAGFILDDDGTPLSITEDEQHKIDDLLASMDMPRVYQERLDYVKRLVDEDPKVVAQVLKTWVRKDVG
ncbi:MAG: flagellar basal-body MS-ring/collar protein FliF [Methylococcales bacterium]|nr:flagellar basal-body MS-ring/collar protein FliF [Methylococcales bacterium]